MTKSIFYHAGCPVCVSAEQDILSLIGEESVEVVHLGEEPSKIDEAEQAGLKSVPALVTPKWQCASSEFWSCYSRSPSIILIYKVRSPYLIILN